MNDVIELFGNCDAEKCKRAERKITSKDDLVIIGEKMYHKGCEPTKEEQEARQRSSV